MSKKRPFEDFLPNEAEKISKQKIADFSKSEEISLSRNFDSENGELKIHLSQPYNMTAKDIGMDTGWVRLYPKMKENIPALSSFGFSACVAIICRSVDNKYISLRHDSSWNLGEGEENEELNEIICEEVERIEEISGQNCIVEIGFSDKGYKEIKKEEFIIELLRSIKETMDPKVKEFYDDAFKGNFTHEGYHKIEGYLDPETKKKSDAIYQETSPDFIQNIEEEKADRKFFCDSLKKYCTIKRVIDLPQGTVLVDNRGNVRTDIPMEIISDARAEAECKGKENPNNAPLVLSGNKISHKQQSK